MSTIKIITKNRKNIIGYICQKCLDDHLKLFPLTDGEELKSIILEWDEPHECQLCGSILA